LKEKVRAVFAAGVDYVQIREKDLEARALAALVEEVAEIRAATVRERANGQPHQPNSRPSRLLVNDRLDVARTCGADGVHLPADALPVSAVRGFVGKDWIVGVACHSIAEVEKAASAGANYVLVAPVFGTASKPGMKPMGLAAFAEICGHATIPVYALGGVSMTNARACVEAGAKGLAGIRLFQQSPDLPALCGHLRSL
jgi:thiamine-phosphate pyrophosphorylase